MTQLPSELRWIAFDLDDTLHYYARFCAPHKAGRSIGGVT